MPNTFKTVAEGMIRESHTEFPARKVQKSIWGKRATV